MVILKNILLGIQYLIAMKKYLNLLYQLLFISSFKMYMNIEKMKVKPKNNNLITEAGWLT